MELEELCEGLLEALERWDEEILPLGLYSSDELPGGTRAQYLEWLRVIVPFLERAGAKRLGQQRSGGLWRFDGLGAVRIELVRIARIKVRRYGSGYQLDKREHRDWVAGDLHGPLQALSSSEPPADAAQARVVLLIAFDKTATPLGGDIRVINDRLQPDQSQIIFRTRCWMDKAKRGFGVRLAVWARPMPQG